MTFQEYLQVCVAVKLREIADAVESGNITAFKFTWDGGEKAELEARPRAYAKAIQCTVGFNDG